MPLHADFADLAVTPGAADILRRPDRFALTNIVALGGAPDMHPHVPTKVGQVGTAVFWESTGAADALPFWNTNLRGDVLLYLIAGSVRVEFREMEGTEPYGSYEARTGDLMLLPRDIAHRTYSGDGRRRISLEIIEHDPRWDALGWVASVAPDPSLRLGGLAFSPAPDVTGVALDGTTAAVGSSFLLRGCRALVAYGLHLGHNEFEGGLVVRDEPPGDAAGGGPGGEDGGAAGDDEATEVTLK
ncbi:MAG: hypothetical protein ACRDZR_18230, partial [Acidimicrobiales bacterium]